MVLTLNIDRYKSVLARHLPRPIESDEDFERWVNLLQAIDRAPKSTPEQKMLARLMKIAMVEYQRNKHLGTCVSAPLATLKAIMATNNISQVELSRMLGVSRSAVSQIFHGKRGISKASALKLSERFGVPVIAFLA